MNPGTFSRGTYFVHCIGLSLSAQTQDSNELSVRFGGDRIHHNKGLTLASFASQEKHQSIPVAPSPPDPLGIIIVLPWMANFGGGTFELSNPPGWGRKTRANAPSSINTATFLLIAQSSSAILSFLTSDFMF